MGINTLPTIKSYWSIDEGLGNPLIQKAMTRERFLDILQNINFADNHKELPPKDSDKYDRASKLRPLFNHLEKHFQKALQPECHQSTDEHMCKFKGKSIMIKRSKDKVKVTCPTVIHEYNQLMGGADLSDQMKLTYEVDRRSKFRFYLLVFFDFLDIAVANSSIVYKKLHQHFQ